jgi:D-glycero-D-manno-heptose 1,7-bisphosphate phosphatase
MTSPPLGDLAKRPAIFFDRDGVLNVDHGFVVDPAKLDWIAGAREAVLMANQANFVTIVISNQSGIGRGMFTMADVDHFHSVMQAQLAQIGARVDGFYYCPYLPNAWVEDYRHPDHPDRKPNPGMILRAAADFNIDLSRSLMIGDRSTDIEAGERAGVRGLLYRTGHLDQLLGEVMPSL